MNFFRVAATAAPSQPAAVSDNYKTIIKIIKDCHKKEVQLLVLPELCLTAATCGDLFYDELLLRRTELALMEIVKASDKKEMLIILGLPIQSKQSRSVYSAAALINNGSLIGFVSSKALTIREMQNNGQKQIPKDESEEIDILGKTFTVSHNAQISCYLGNTDKTVNIILDFADEYKLFDMGKYKYNADIVCLLGAINTRAGMETFVKDKLRVMTELSFNSYIFANASSMESTTDYVFNSELCIAELGEVLEDNFTNHSDIIITDIDLNRIRAAKYRDFSFKNDDSDYDEIFECSINNKNKNIMRTYNTLPYLPKENREKEEYLSDIMYLQYKALSKRMLSTGIKNLIIGMSGGLDSTVALVSAVYTIKKMGADPKNITAVMMPGFGSSERTKKNALALCKALDVNYEIIDITNALTQHLKDIGHESDSYNATFENAQARERMQILMDMANDKAALVLGTSDMSEIALGFSTYNGDHMGMYGMNNSLPKTVLKQLIKYMADIYTKQGKEEISKLLLDVYETPISPELLPAKENEISQKTEELIGPYELHDFFLYYFIKYRYSPNDIFELTKLSFADVYTNKTILKYLKIFYKRFFAAQFKRSCSYDAPKLLDFSLSPRVGFLMPSDAVVQLWIREIERLENEI